MALELEEEFIELFGIDSLSGFEGLDFIKGYRIKWAFGIDGYWVGKLNDFVEMAVRDFEVVEFALKCPNGIEHWMYLLIISMVIIIMMYGWFEISIILNESYYPFQSYY